MPPIGGRGPGMKVLLFTMVFGVAGLRAGELPLLQEKHDVPAGLNWDRWIGPRGFALFALGGNIVTAWSWFGTNQLGIGLHSYGFTSGVLLLLAGYVLSQLLLIAAGLLLARRRPPAISAAS